MDPVESTQKHTSMNPKAGICTSFDFDLLNWAIFPVLLARLPVLTTGVGVIKGTGGATAGDREILEETLELATLTRLIFLGDLDIFDTEATEDGKFFFDFIGAAFLMIFFLSFLPFLVLETGRSFLAIYFIVFVPIFFLDLSLEDSWTYYLPSSMVA